jgi:hypothetical protein
VAIAYSDACNSPQTKALPHNMLHWLSSRLFAVHFGGLVHCSINERQSLASKQPVQGPTPKSNASMNPSHKV